MEELLYQIIGRLYTQNLILQEQIQILQAENEELKKPAESEEQYTVPTQGEGKAE